MQGELGSTMQLASAAVLLAAIARVGAAATLTVHVVDESGAPIAGVAVHATPTAPSTGERAAPSTAVMDQIDNAFVPHVLVIETGTPVLFPNSDSVSHHVYSFSDAKSFELGLYKGNVYPPVQFDSPGIVVLGCNIHDGMLGYIVVVATPHFGLTDADGSVRLDNLGSGAHFVDLWTPRARPNGLPAATRVDVIDTVDNELRFTIRGKLAHDHSHSSAGLSWDRY